MKDIKLNKWYLKLWYVLCCISVLFGFIIVWLIILGLLNYGKNTLDNTKRQKGLLNMTYQKFIWGYGDIVVTFAIIMLIAVIVITLLGQ